MDDKERFLRIKCVTFTFGQKRIARGGHGLPKVSPRPDMPYPFTPCRRAIPETALQLFWGWPACRVGSLRLSSTPLDTPRRTRTLLASQDIVHLSHAELAPFKVLHHVKFISDRLK
jgi:hypothetical protein